MTPDDAPVAFQPHTHHFIRWAGGTNLEMGISDDCYDCACGAKMRIDSTPEQHFRTPGQIDIVLGED